MPEHSDQENTNAVDESLERAECALGDLRRERLTDMNQLEYLRKQAKDNNFSRNFLALITEDR